jgi:hypothetical protein
LCDSIYVNVWLLIWVWNSEEPHEVPIQRQKETKLVGSRALYFHVPEPIHL